MGGRKTQVRPTERLQAGAGVGRRGVSCGDQGRLEPLETLLRDRPEELLAVREVMVGGAGSDAGLSRQLTQVQRLDPALGDRLDRSLDQRAP